MSRPADLAGTAVADPLHLCCCWLQTGAIDKVMDSQDESGVPRPQKKKKKHGFFKKIFS